MPQTTITASIAIAAAPDAVWNALVDPEKGRIWRGAKFETDWLPGSAITITPLIGSKRHRDSELVIDAKRSSMLAYSFFPRVSGLPDRPENHSLVTMRLAPDGADTALTVTHTVPPSPVRRGKNFEIGPESGEKHVAFYWRNALPLLRDLVEGRDSAALAMARLPVL